MPKVIDPELKARALRLVRGVWKHRSEVISDDDGGGQAVAMQVGASARRSLRRWVAQAEVDGGTRRARDAALSRRLDPPARRRRTGACVEDVAVVRSRSDVLLRGGTRRSQSARDHGVHRHPARRGLRGLCRAVAKNDSEQAQAWSFAARRPGLEDCGEPRAWPRDTAVARRGHLAGRCPGRGEQHRHTLVVIGHDTGRRRAVRARAEDRRALRCAVADSAASARIGRPGPGWRTPRPARPTVARPVARDDGPAPRRRAALAPGSA